MKVSYIFLASLMISSCGSINPDWSHSTATTTNVTGSENIVPGRGLSMITKGAYIDLRSPGCIDHDGIESYFSGSKLLLSARSIETSRDLEESLNRKIGLNVEDPAEKAKEFSAQFNHKSVNSSIAKSKVSVGEILIRKEFPFEFLKNPKPSPNLIAASQSNNPYAVYQSCGDSFIYGFKRVIELNGYVICKASNATEKKSIDNSFNGFGIYKDVKLGGGASQQAESIDNISTRGCSIVVYSRGGSGNINLSSVAAFVQSASDYVNNADRSDSWVESIETLKYSDLVDNTLHAALSKQIIDFSRASELALPLSKAAERILSDYLATGSESALKTIVKIGNQLKHCSEAPWNPAKNCVANSVPSDVDIFDIIQ